MTIYSCGPTVYSYSHIGNFRTFVFQDLLRPCFKEDEWILIALGAALGALAGLAQALFVF